MHELKYIEILKKNNELANNFSSLSYDVSIFSNISVNLIKEILEYSLRFVNIPAKVNFGNFDNIIQESFKKRDDKVIIIFWEICNFIEGFQYNCELMNDDEIEILINKIKSEINIVLTNLKSTSLVLFNKFSAKLFSNNNLNLTNLELIASKLNDYVDKLSFPNLKIVDIDKAISAIGIKKSIDLRYFYLSKSLYSVDFFKEYVNSISPVIKAINGIVKKAIIFDCDNTLWKGILGEDGFDGIEMSKNTGSGKIFHEIQKIAISLAEQGVIIGLCSKNNIEDVTEIIEKHPDFLLKDEYLTIKKINWNDKVSNLKQISKELNIGLDSLVFVDDSSFEINLIKEKLPSVSTIQVPEKLFEYPNLLRENLNLFYKFSLTKEDVEKNKMYKQQQEREKLKEEYSNIDDYLKTLDIKLSVFIDEKDKISRISQMSQKTNQFNLTTKRYTENDISNFIENKNSFVFAISVSDKFGDYGVTGLSIIKIIDEDNKSAFIDTFLMSCRIIGRNIEYVFLNYIMEWLKNKHVTTINAEYIKTIKNEQVQEFYENCSFQIKADNDKIKEYSLNLTDFKNKNIDYIHIKK